MIFRKRTFAAALALLATAACSAQSTPPAQTVGLFTTLPILWPETAGAADLLKTDTVPPHWARDVLARRGTVRPLDTLDNLGGVNLLVLAQPRPLSPQENVALDRWVRGGGRVLLLADPMLTADSAYALGDRRRPQAIALLSPILARWGLALRFDESQPAGERIETLYDTAFPVNLPGRFETTGGGVSCRIKAGGLAARCLVGKGQVVAVADAALLEDVEADAVESRSAALDRLLDQLDAGNRG